MTTLMSARLLAANASRLAADRFYPGKGQYAEWGEIVAGRIAQRLAL